MALNKNLEAFVIHITSFCLSQILIHLAQITQIALLVVKKIVIPVEYLDYTDVFLKKSVVKLSNRSDIKKHSINLKPSK